jgi:hypothetical protein
VVGEAKEHRCEEESTARILGTNSDRIQKENNKPTKKFPPRASEPAQIRHPNSNGRSLQGGRSGPSLSTTAVRPLPSSSMAEEIAITSDTRESNTNRKNAGEDTSLTAQLQQPVKPILSAGAETEGETQTQSAPTIHLTRKDRGDQRHDGIPVTTRQDATRKSVSNKTHTDMSCI